jgi:hypothetical protein
MAKTKLTNADIETSFIDFLKQYSCLDNEFIDDFFKNVNKVDIESYYDCVISLNKLVKWLNISDAGKEKLVTKINRDYVKGEDYITKKRGKKDKAGEKNHKLYYITIVLAKKFYKLQKHQKVIKLENIL